MAPQLKPATRAQRKQCVPDSDYALRARTSGPFGLSDKAAVRYASCVLLWVHLITTGLYIGVTVGLAVFANPSAGRLSDPLHRRRQIARVLRVYDPLAIALLGIMLMTGAWSITGLKQSLGGAYFDSIGVYLAWKLGLAFLVLMAGVYVSLGLGHRIVREDDWSDEVDEARLDSMLSRLRGTCWTAVALTLVTVAVASGR